MSKTAAQRAKAKQRTKDRAARQAGFKNFAEQHAQIRANQERANAGRVERFNEKHGTNFTSKDAHQVHHLARRHQDEQANRRADVYNARQKQMANNPRNIAANKALGYKPPKQTPRQHKAVHKVPEKYANDTRWANRTNKYGVSGSGSKSRVTVSRSSGGASRSRGTTSRSGGGGGSRSGGGLNTGAVGTGSWGKGSADFYGHADYQRDKNRGMSDAQIKALIDRDPSKMGNGGVTGDLYKQISAGAAQSGRATNNRTRVNPVNQGRRPAARRGNSVNSGRDSNIGRNSGSHTVGDNNSGTVGNNNAVVDNNVDNTQEQRVDQDNDITTSINGNNNTVLNNQDNSIRQYGGDNRSFVYNSTGGGGGLYDSPVSAATMGGFYDVDDSPAAQAKFNDMYSTMNRDNQKRYAGTALANFAKYGKTDARAYTDESMTNALSKMNQNSFDMSTVQTGLVLGDIWNNKYNTEKWQFGEDPDKIESNAEEIAKKAKEDVEDV